MKLDALLVLHATRRAAYDAADAASRAAMAELYEVSSQIIELKWGIKEGSFVKCRGRVFQVMSIRRNAPVDEKPWAFGRQVKKDGNLEKKCAHRYLFAEWELCDRPDNFVNG